MTQPENNPQSLLDGLSWAQKFWLKTVVRCADDGRELDVYGSGGPTYFRVSQKLEEMGLVQNKRAEQYRSIYARMGIKKKIPMHATPTDLGRRVFSLMDEE